MANKGQSRPDLDAITLANMAKVRADRNEHLLAVSLGESALLLAREHSREFVPEILARLSMSYVALSALDRAATSLDEADAIIRGLYKLRPATKPGAARAGRSPPKRGQPKMRTAPIARWWPMPVSPSRRQYHLRRRSYRP